jgi:hypothetical protein
MVQRANFATPRLRRRADFNVKMVETAVQEREITHSLRNMVKHSISLTRLIISGNTASAPKVILEFSVNTSWKFAPVVNTFVYTVPSV